MTILKKLTHMLEGILLLKVFVGFGKILENTSCCVFRSWNLQNHAAYAPTNKAVATADQKSATSVHLSK